MKVKYLLKDQDESDLMDILCSAKVAVNKALEESRSNGDIGSSLEAEITLYTDNDLADKLNLLGEELRSATRKIEKTEKIQLVGTSSLTKLYARALSLVGREVDLHSGDDLVRLGLTAAWQFLYPQKE